MDFSDEEEAFITCEVCDLPFTGIEPFEQHLKGKKHQKQVKDRKRRLQVKSTDDGSEAQDPDNSEDEDFSCDICETAFSGIIPYTQHMKSNPHLKAVRRKKAEEDQTKYDEEESSDSELPDDLDEALKEIVPEPYGICEICEKQFSGPEGYRQHMKSKTHSKRKHELQLLKKIKSVLNKSKTEAENDSEKNSKDQRAHKVFADVEDDEELECSECHKVFSGAVSFAQHMISKAHAKKQLQNKLLEELKNIKELELEDDDSSSEYQQPGEEQDDIESFIDPVLTCDICGVAFSGPQNAKAHLKSKGHQKAVKWRKYLAHKNKQAKKSSKETTPDTQQDIASKNSELVDSTGKAFTNDEKKDALSDSGNVTEPSAPALAEHNEECPPYQEVEEQLPSDKVDHEIPGERPSSPEDSKAKFLYPVLPDGDDGPEKKKDASSGNSVNLENDSSESESISSEDEKRVKKSEDGDVTADSKATNDDTPSSCDAQGGKKKKSKTAKCKTGMGKLVTTVANIFD